MTLFRFCHAQKNAFAYFVALTLREVALGLRSLDFGLPVAPCSIDRLLMIFPLSGHAALKRKDLQTAQQKLSERQRRGITSKSATGRIRRGEPGATPQDYGNPKTSALKARFTLAELTRAFSAWPSGPIEFLGRCPQARVDMAPLALNMHEVGCSSLPTCERALPSRFNQQAPSRRSRPARRALVAVVP